MTQAPSQSTSTGHTLEQLSPSTLESSIVSAEPCKLPLEIFLMNRGTSMCVGHAAVHGASKQKRQRLASTTYSCAVSAGCSSANLSASVPIDLCFHKRFVHVRTSVTE